MTNNQGLLAWVAEVTAMCQPKDVHWCTGSQEEYQLLLDMMVASGAAIPLHPKLRPGSYLFRSDVSDVARVEERTFVSTPNREEAGPNNNWMDPATLKATLTGLFTGCMAGRTLYVVPFVMGPLGSPFSLVGVEITDSPYVVVNMRLMTLIGQAALDVLGDDGQFIPCLHSVGMPLLDGQADVPWPCAPMDKKYIAHFPEEGSIWSFGSGYGGNALLGKKCLALRIASGRAKQEGWLAEHMLILGLTDKEGQKTWMAAAFPSACGKTNLAMMVPKLPGYQVETVGDDIAWLRKGKDGRLYAVNPERGFFGVAPGTNWQSNPNAMATISKNTLFTNVALTKEGDVWWEGMDATAPEHLIDWQGKEWTPASGRPAAHPNARFTAAASQCPVISTEWQSPEGVPISAILLGGRRAHTVPLVMKSRDWAQGVLMGAMMGSELTSAVITDKLGQVRRDPFAMLPFCGYNIKDYLKHWLAIGETLEPDKQPQIFHVNWFRKDENGCFLWPGFGDNVRVLAWIANQVHGKHEAVETALGLLPQAGSINLEGLTDTNIAALLAIDEKAWQKEIASTHTYYEQFGGLPEELEHLLLEMEQKL